MVQTKKVEITLYRFKKKFGKNIYELKTLKTLLLMTLNKEVPVLRKLVRIKSSIATATFC